MRSSSEPCSSRAVRRISRRSAAAIQSVAVTDDPTAFSEIASLYQMLQSGSPYTTVKTNADTLADGMSLYKG